MCDLSESTALSACGGSSAGSSPNVSLENIVEARAGQQHIVQQALPQGRVIAQEEAMDVQCGGGSGELRSHCCPNEPLPVGEACFFERASAPFACAVPTAFPCFCPLWSDEKYDSLVRTTFIHDCVAPSTPVAGIWRRSKSLPRTMSLSADLLASVDCCSGDEGRGVLASPPCALTSPILTVSPGIDVGCHQTYSHVVQAAPGTEAQRPHVLNLADVLLLN